MSINRILADLGKAVDSSSTGNFLNKEASGAEFNPVQWSDINSAPTILDSALASAIIDSAYVQLRQTGVGSGGLDSATTIALIDSSYVGARASTGGSGFVKYQYTATASQTTFQDSDVNGNVLSYDADYILVHYNGVLLPSADYTATDGSSVVLATGADSGSIIGIAKWGAAAGSSSGGVSWYGDRGVFINGQNSTSIQYVDITTLGNATDFGDTTAGTYRYTHMSVSNSTYGVYGGGYDYGASDNVNIIDYITIATPSNASDFGDLTKAKRHGTPATNGILGLFMGGYDGTSFYTTDIDYITISTSSNATSGPSLYDGGYGAHQDTIGDGTYGLFMGGYVSPNRAQIQRITIATSGTATDFGDTTVSNRGFGGGVSDLTYGLHCGGGASPYKTIDYVTIATPGNASDFGDLDVGRRRTMGCANSTRGVIGGGFDGATDLTISYVTIATPGNASDFGDMNSATEYGSALSGSPS